MYAHIRVQDGHAAWAQHVEMFVDRAKLAQVPDVGTSIYPAPI